MHHASHRSTGADRASDGVQDAGIPSANSLAEVLRAVAATGRPVAAARDLVDLSLSVQTADAPSIVPVTVLESTPVHRIPDTGQSHISAFLDGVQRTMIVAHVRGAPLLFAFIAAVVRERNERRMATWREPLVKRAVFASRAAVGDTVWRELESRVPLIDCTANSDSAHPLAIRARLLAEVQRTREQLENSLAVDWYEQESRTLLVDGGISSLGALVVDPAAPPAPRLVGVVKSHTTLYGTPESLDTLCDLDEGSRSALFLIHHRVRPSVLSWYLRLRRASSGDPLFGLVRVELPAPAGWSSDQNASPPDRDVAPFLGAVANLSSALLAERTPVSLPDARWDRLVYGVYDCERYLRAIADHV